MSDDIKITTSLKVLKEIISTLSSNAIARYVADLQRDNKLPFDLVKFSRRKEVSDGIVEDLDELLRKGAKIPRGEKR